MAAAHTQVICTQH